MKTKNIIPTLLLLLFIASIITIIGTLQQEAQAINIHDPYSYEELVKIIDPPLDITKPLNEAIYEKYYYTASIYDVTIIANKPILEYISFKKYGNLEAFVFTHPHDSLMKKFERPIYIVELDKKESFIEAVNNTDTLVFRKSGKFSWTFYAKK